MFVDDFCEDWDSTKSQNDFIENYFGKRKVNSKKASLESVDKSRNTDILKNSTSKSDSKHFLNYENECTKRKKKEKQILNDSFQKHCSEIQSLSENMEVNGTLNCASNSLKNKKRKKKLENRNISGNLSEQLHNIESFNDNSKIVDQFTEDSIKSVNFESNESSLNCQKMKKRKKRKRTKSICTEESSKLLVETGINSKAISDFSVMNTNASSNNPDSNCSTKKKMNNNLKSIEKRLKLNTFSCEGESTSLRNSFDSPEKLNNISKTCSYTLFNDSDSHKNKKMKNKFENSEKSSKLDEFSAEEEPTNSKVTHNLPEKKSNLYQNKAYQKLQAAKFRYLNEMLYTNSGKDSLIYFQKNTDEFLDYHVGYQSQVSKWPINPVDILIQEIRKIKKQAVIADLGCGEAKIAEVFPKRTVHSFDLIALKDCVTACDIANVPLPSSSVDVVIFCLSLMGTNWKDYLKEGQRILKLGGMMKIAEIESRIENVQHFIKEIENFGFSLINQDLSQKMFVFLNFKRVSKSKKPSKIPEVTLKPCLYKKR